jgi:hypothetical protein
MPALLVFPVKDFSGRLAFLKRGRPRLPKLYCSAESNAVSAMRWVSFALNRPFQPAAFLQPVAKADTEAEVK